MLGNLPQAKQPWFNRGISLTIWPIGKVLKSSTRVYPVNSTQLRDRVNESHPKWENECVRHIAGSLIRRDANDPRESLPVPWMWAVPAGADVCGVRVGDAEG